MEKTLGAPLLHLQGALGEPSSLGEPSGQAVSFPACKDAGIFRASMEGRAMGGHAPQGGAEADGPDAGVRRLVGASIWRILESPSV